MAAAVKCPLCGAELELVTDGQVGVEWFIPSTGRTELRLEARPFGACPRCEFCVDLAPAVAELKAGAR
jgi:hypothetical protein